MEIAKLRNGKGGSSFHEVLKTGTVQFDPRPGWLLLATPPGERRPRQILQWEHPEDGNLVWIRPFRFA